MSVKLNDNNIASIKLNENEIGKAYLNNEIVFIKDRPVWLVRTYKNVMYSFDGVHFNILHSYNSGARIRGACYCNGNFFYGHGYDSGSPYLYTISADDVRNKIDNITNTSTPLSTDVTACASDGDKCIVITSRSSSNQGIYYSLNGGSSWVHRSFSVGTGSIHNENVKYIGDGRFWIATRDISGPGSRKKKYFYWTKNNPRFYILCRI